VEDFFTVRFGDEGNAGWGWVSLRPPTGIGLEVKGDGAVIGESACI